MENKMYLKDEDLRVVFNNRIIQNDNSNANSELFIFNDTILKIYFGDNRYNNYNLSVINNIISKKNILGRVDELVLPKDLVIYNDKVVGFTMPYVKGNTLNELIKNDSLSDKDIKSIFTNLLNIIKEFEEFSFSFCIGDIHEKNILIDDNNNI